jgi:CBS domain-containing protein
MKARDVMTPDPACCFAETSIRDVAQMFVEHDVGSVPVVESSTRKPIGIVTDRDIACRAIAAGKNALDLRARDCMSAPCITVSPDWPLDDCCDAMEQNRVRRLLVVDRAGGLCGVISQADIALKGKMRKASEVVREVSRRTMTASSVPI